MSQNKALDILCLWQPNPELLEYLQNGLQNPEAVRFHFPDSEDGSLTDDQFRNKPIIMGWRAKKEQIEGADTLQLFLNPGAGVQHLGFLKDHQAELGFAVCNSHGNAYLTAQHAVALSHALTNRLIFHDHRLRNGKFRDKDSLAPSVTLRGISVGLLGFGHVNRYVLQFLGGYDLKFQVCNRSGQAPEGLTFPQVETFYKAENKLEFFQSSDIVICSLPQTPDTIDFVGSKELRALGENGYLVNVGRGKVVNENDLYQALKEKHIQAAAIDTWYNYQPEEKDGKKFPYDLPFHELDNILLSPHRGASPMSDLPRWNDVIENINRFIAGRTDFLNVVDLKEGY